MVGRRSKRRTESKATRSGGGGRVRRCGVMAGMAAQGVKLVLLVGLVAAVVMVCALERRHGDAQDNANGGVVTAERLKKVGEPGAFHNLWAVHVDGDRDAADQVARAHGFRNRGPIGGLDNFYHFELSCDPEQEAAGECVQPHRHAAPHTHRLLNESRVIWAEQQRLLHRPRHYAVDLDTLRAGNAGNAGTAPDEDMSALASMDAAAPGGGGPESQGGLGRVRRDFDADAYAKTINDPSFSVQWHLYQSHSDNHHNVLPVWNEGITGKGVVVTIVDDGIEYTHPDLKANYDPKASTDINGNDDDPFPDERYPINKHGTRCSGEVAAARDNRKCGVGIAYEANIGGIRMLDGPVTDSVEAHSLSLNPQHIDVYSNSWGPNDDGRTMEGPALLARKAFGDGIAKGRGGLGSIYLFASGNGGSADDCNCDGYTNSPYTLSIGAIDEHNNVPYYTEKCASTLAVTYSSGSGTRSITTVDLHNGCTHAHTGTSAAAPLAAGLVALVLQANPKLTWRDVQHVIVRGTRTPGNSWDTNSAGFKMSYAFGFGVLDAKKLVDVARTWENRPKQLQHKNTIKPNSAIPATQSMSDALTVAFDVRRQDTTIAELEHVQVMVNINSPRRGDIVLDIEAPSGTKSKLLTRRASDYSNSGIHWTFMSVRHWGESPLGKWKLYARSFGTGSAKLVDATLILYGTTATGDHSGGTTTCPKGTYRDSSGQCLNCDAECDSKGCTGAGPTACVSCQHYEHAGTCVADCGDIGMLGVDDSKECVKCHPQCKGCFGRTEYECVACVGATLREGGQVKCVDTCPKHHYLDDDNQCQACDAECNTCAGPGPNNCMACTHVQLFDGTCVDACPEETYESSDGVCMACNGQCRDTCTGAGPTKCSACKGLRLQLQEDDDSSVVTKCVEACPPSRVPNEHQVCVCANHTYPDHQSLACLPCHAECLSGCDGPDVTDCIGPCAHAQHSTECVDECPADYFASTDTAAFHALYPHATIRSSNVCLPCNDQCASGCTGPSAHDCTSDSSGNRCLAFEDEDGACVPACNKGTYEDVASSKCRTCHAECDGCIGAGPGACLRCKHVSHDGTCLASCPVHMYATERSVCEECHPECADVCFGPSDRQCFEAAADVSATEPSCKSVHLGQQCLSECPVSHYEDIDFACQACDGECGEEGCHAAGAASCNSCKHVTASDGTCARQCQADEYVDDAQMCRPCDASCKHGCSGPAAGDCLDSGDCTTQHQSCPSDSYFDTAVCECVKDACSSGITYNGNCVPSCPSGTYASEDGTTCHACADNCDACTGPTQQECTACVHAGVVDTDGTLTCFDDSSCRDPARQYLDSTDNLCKPCHAECNGCFAPTNRDCKACVHVQSQGTCLAECPRGFYAPHAGDGGDEGSSAGTVVVCQPCHGECASGCSGPGASNCTACRHVQLDGQCISTCPVGTYHNTATDTCEACDGECLAGCTGPTAADCAGGKCVNFIHKGTCVSACPVGFFANEQAMCEACHPSCPGRCVNATPSGCVLDTSTTPSTPVEPSPSPPPPSSSTTSTVTAGASTHAQSHTTARAHQPPATADTTTTPADRTSSSGAQYLGRVPTSTVEIAVAAVLLAVIAIVVLFVVVRLKGRANRARVSYQRVKLTELLSDDDSDDDLVLHGDHLAPFDVVAPSVSSSSSSQSPPTNGAGRGHARDVVAEGTSVQLLADFPQSDI
ncbi:protease PC6 isoform A [Salpingoeca rosetta]|uniref:Protease PC6 isoform A n=1 Tax=Salpingoeca rosetta (strain ATCC 50818 / BSB-021) TaxID=946362 RepID=F2TWG3_SALR5|nr:protease PC6 isoform A [Salpingoeca rosetta]EGD72409.1 protease PC6 isoform A [Salpingoeca rosetta]|eukprot:XP_004998978.1 protease PC6 isoform A [Salpingoeca rosetta]